jgi:predicted DsbA family dithiol-disulfide isomerase
MSQEFTIDVWSDFVCPWCYLGAVTLQQLEESHQVTVRWHSFELRPKGSPPIPEWYKEKIKQMRPQFKAIAKERYDIDIQQGLFGVNSRPALIGMKYAEHQGKGEIYHQQVFEAYFKDGLNIEEIDVLRNIVTNIGLDADQFEEALSDGKLNAEVSADIETASQYGITGVPAMILVDKYILNGAQPYEELVSIIEQIKQQENLA